MRERHVVLLVVPQIVQRRQAGVRSCKLERYRTLQTMPRNRSISIAAVNFFVGLFRGITSLTINQKEVKQPVLLRYPEEGNSQVEAECQERKKRWFNKKWGKMHSVSRLEQRPRQLRYIDCRGWAMRGNNTEWFLCLYNEMWGIRVRSPLSVPTLEKAKAREVKYRVQLHSRFLHTLHLKKNKW